MAKIDSNEKRYEHLIRLVRVARGLEAGGFYNATKLYWALAYSEEIRASNEQEVPEAMEALDREMEVVIGEVEGSDAKPELITAMRHGQKRARDNQTIPWTEIPDVFVCRTCGELILGQAPSRCPTCGARAFTSREFVPAYFLEPLPPQQALYALESAPAEIEESIDGLSEEQMAQAPRPGEWAVRDVLAHLLVAQGLLAGRVEKMLSENNPSLKGVAAWAMGGEEALPAQEIVERYRTSRQATVERLKGISAQDWWRTAQHEEFAEVTVLQQASYFAKHDRSHLPQIDAIRRAIGA